MKKFIVKYKDSEKVFGWYSSRVEASFKVVEYINDFNDGLEGDYVSPFDFTLEEVECKEVNEVITDFESARKALGIKPNDEFTVVRKKHSDIEFDDVESLVDDINPKNIEALMALNKLFTIAEAWNKEDGFVPDFSDTEQEKWFPVFYYNRYSAWFVYEPHVCYQHSTAYSPFGCRLCFKNYERAAQFGKQFEELFNKVFLINK